MNDDDRSDEADRKRTTLWLAVLLVGLGLFGFGSLWLDWEQGAELALGVAIVLIPGFLGLQKHPRSEDAERRRAVVWRGTRRVMFVGFAVTMAWVMFRLLQRLS